MPASHADNRFDLIRLVAAWLVLFSHAYPIAGLGQDPLARTNTLDTLGAVGVFFFFALSGFLLVQSLERSESVVDFAWRRAIRIYPALIVTCLLTISVLGPLYTPLSSAEYWSHEQTWEYARNMGAWDIRYALPLVFATNPQPHAINGSLWSLPYELTCYVALALTFVLPGALRWKSLVVFALLIVLVLLRPWGAAPFEKYNSTDLFHLKLGLPFCMGVCLAAWRHRVQPSAWFGGALLVASFVAPSEPLRMILVVTGWGMVALGLALNALWLPRLPQSMGDWSYGLYLYAYPVQQMLAHAGLHRWGIEIYVAVSTIAALMLACLSWHLVEKHALRLKELPGRLQLLDRSTTRRAS